MIKPVIFDSFFSSNFIHFNNTNWLWKILWLSLVRGRQMILISYDMKLIIIIILLLFKWIRYEQRSRKMYAHKTLNVKRKKGDLFLCKSLAHYVYHVRAVCTYRCIFNFSIFTGVQITTARIMSKYLHSYEHLSNIPQINRLISKPRYRREWERVR